VTPLALLHVARRELGFEEEDWRAMLTRVTGLSSLRAMDEAQRQAVLAELKRLGFRLRRTRGGRAAPVAAKPYQRQIHALWRSCHALGEIENGSREALRAFCKRFVAHGVTAVSVDPDLLSWEQARPVIEALKRIEARGIEKAAARGREERP
jgi:hypothetical protein